MLVCQLVCAVYIHYVALNLQNCINVNIDMYQEVKMV